MRVPKLLRHKAKTRDRAYVNLGGKRRYLGDWGSTEARQAYADLRREIIDRGNITTLTETTVREVMESYLEWAESYYRHPDGSPTGEITNCRNAWRHMGLCLDESAIDFGPRKLKAVRDQLIEQDLARSTVNKYTVRIVAGFRVAVENEMVPPSVHQALAAVKPLARGRSAAREADPVLPVPEDDLQAALDELEELPRVMCRLLLITGMRPGECRLMRWRDIDQTGEVWMYTPAQHKTQHHGKQRVVFLGPKAQLLLRPLAGEPGYFFRRSTFSVKPYSVSGLQAAVRRACDRAGVERWAPNQLRHNAATRLRAEHGLHAARVILGHADERVTTVYAEADMEQAKKIAQQVG